MSKPVLDPTTADLLQQVQKRLDRIVKDTAHHPSFLKSGPFVDDGKGMRMDLAMAPSSKEANRLIDSIVASMEKKQGSKPGSQVRKAIGSIVADLITAQGRGAAYGYRSTGSDTFGSCSFSRPAFVKAAEALEEISYLEWRIGYKRFGRSEPSPGSVFTPSPALAIAVADAGIDPCDFMVHFNVSRSIELRTATKKKHYKYGVLVDGEWGVRYSGKPIGIDTASSFHKEKAGEMDFLNEFIARQNIAGCEPVRLRRIYNNGDTTGADFTEGGRLYAIGGGYQMLSKEERKDIAINGEATVEIDISGSHPTIAAALNGTPIAPGTDIYCHPKVERIVMKMFITRSIGAGSMPVRWDEEQMIEYGKDAAGMNAGRHGCPDPSALSKDFPIADVTGPALDAFPILPGLLASGWNGIRLQKVESDIIVEAMLDLAKNHGSPSLPVHDSLIVPASKEAEGRRALTDAFKRHTGATPTLKLS